jgi:molybdate transport system substrate-binding protein
MIKRFFWLNLVFIIILCGCGNLATNSLSSIGKKEASNPLQSRIPTETVVLQRTLTVYAAASLTGAFKDIGKEFETTNPGVRVIFNFSGSQILRSQLEQGAVADVFASADQKNMAALVSDNLVTPNSYQDFATNKLVVILPPGNPGNVLSLTDLGKPGLKLVLADASVPAGNYARQMLSKMSTDSDYGSEYSTKVLANVVSNETDVKQVVAKVGLGEGDAGIVYISDQIAAPDLGTINIPDKFNIMANYPIAVLSSAPEPGIAAAFVEYIKSPAGQEILSKWGLNPK